MELPVLQASERGGGCVARQLIEVDLGDLGRVELIVSSCQRRRFEREINDQISRIKDSRITLEAAQQQLQSWIDGGSPCDMPYADPADRLSMQEAMEAEIAHWGGGSAGILVLVPRRLSVRRYGSLSWPVAGQLICFVSAILVMTLIFWLVL